jgi:hypothetical protein
MERRKLVAIALVTVLATAHPASAGDGAAVAAGVLGGLAVGGIIGSSAAPPPYYAPPPPVVVYEEPEPLYSEPASACYWTRGEPVWDAYRAAWVRPRVQVCD